MSTVWSSPHDIFHGETPSAPSWKRLCLKLTRCRTLCEQMSCLGFFNQRIQQSGGFWVNVKLIGGFIHIFWHPTGVRWCFFLVVFFSVYVHIFWQWLPVVKPGTINLLTQVLSSHCSYKRTADFFRAMFSSCHVWWHPAGDFSISIQGWSCFQVAATTWVSPHESKKNQFAKVVPFPLLSLSWLWNMASFIAFLLIV